MDLKTLQDWVLQRRFKSVPGVIDVTGWGGKTKTFEISVDLDRLVAYGLTLPQLLTALNNSNVNVGGNTVNIGGQSAVIRGVGLIRSMSDIQDTMLIQAGGSPVLVRDVATVTVGHQPRLGIAGQDDSDDIVQGIVLMPGRALDADDQRRRGRDHPHQHAERAASRASGSSGSTTARTSSTSRQRPSCTTWSWASG